MSVQNKPDYKIFASGAKPGEVVTFPNIDRGWGVTLDSTGGIPPMEFYNAIGKRQDEWLLYLTQRGIPVWDSSVSYPANAITNDNGILYISTRENKGSNPSTSQSVWINFKDYLDINNRIRKDAIKQSTGTSLTDIMSQKAITDAINSAVGSYLKLTGGTLTGPLSIKQDGPAFVISPTTENGSCYMQARDHASNAVWYIGRPTDGGTAIYFRNYLTDTEISLHQEGVNIKGKLGLSDYSNFDNRYGQPVGSVVFLLHGDTPAGRYIKANGAAISRTTYADLYAVLGLKYGPGNGSTTFNIPDLRGEFPRFWDDGRGVDSGRVLGTAQGDAMRNLTGTLSRLYGESGGGTGVFKGVSMANSSKNNAEAWNGNRGTEFNASNQVPTAGEFRPRNIALAAWIKY